MTPMPPIDIAHARSLRASRRSSAERVTVIPSCASFLILLFRQSCSGSRVHVRLTLALCLCQPMAGLETHGQLG